MNEAPDEDNPTGSAPGGAEGAGRDDDAAASRGASEAGEGAGETGEAAAEASEATVEASEASEVRAEKGRRRREPTRAPPAPLPPFSRGLRSLYWALWFVLAPLVLACVCVWALTPSSGALLEGGLAFVRSFVREQPVPVGIATLTAFEIAFWAARHRLPLASHAYTPLPAGVAEALRSAFERARALLEEAEAILEAQSQVVKQELSAKERHTLTDALDALESSMGVQPFDQRTFVDALVRAEGEVDVRLGRWRKSEVREYVESVFVAFAVALFLRAFVVEAFKIPSGSMIPTLQVGDHIFVNKFSYGPAIPFTKTRLFSRMPPERGDVMVFAFPEHPEQDFIKRVIAIPGDKLEARGGHPILNGWEVPSCFVGVYTYTEGEPVPAKHEGDLFVEFLDDEAFLTLYDRYSGGMNDYQGPYFVKPGEAYVMGDNRHNSHDSRMWFGGQGGGVPFENIRGRALFVWLSVGERGMAWNRLGAPVMGKPRLPPDMAGLQPALEKCLRERPSLDKTTPPPGQAR